MRLPGLQRHLELSTELELRQWDLLSGLKIWREGFQPVAETSGSAQYILFWSHFAALPQANNCLLQLSSTLGHPSDVDLVGVLCSFKIKTAALV